MERWYLQIDREASSCINREVSSFGSGEIVGASPKGEAKLTVIEASLQGEAIRLFALF